MRSRTASGSTAETRPEYVTSQRATMRRTARNLLSVSDRFGPGAVLLPALAAAKVRHSQSQQVLRARARVRRHCDCEPANCDRSHVEGADDLGVCLYACETDGSCVRSQERIA